MPGLVHFEEMEGKMVSGISMSQDVMDEKERVERGPDDQLQVVGLRKKYHGAPNVAVDNVSFGVSLGDTFALIGPNGAGKTTTLACIRGMERPNAGDIIVGGHSITKARNQARAFLGVCPQVNAIDPTIIRRTRLANQLSRERGRDEPHQVYVS